MKQLKTAIILALLFTGVAGTQAQDDNLFNPIQTGIPSLTIAPDARGGALGDIGAATEADAYSQFWNPAKYAFINSKAGVSFGFTPWLRYLVDDINLSYLVGYYRLNDNWTMGASLHYFSLGDIILTQLGVGDEIINLGTTKPYEMALDVSIAGKLSENFSMATAFRGIYSDMGSGSGMDGVYPAKAIAADIAGYYQNYFVAGQNECLLGLGFHISNIGNKVSYDGDNHFSFLPTNLRLGASVLFPLDDYNSMSISADVNKLLVPTPPDTVTEDWNSDISPIAGIFQSFSDAPGGAKEELREISYSIGAEYAYDNKFFIRGGYHYENPYKGNRQYFSLGTGFRLTAFQLDVAYLISTVPNNPLDQTLRFSLSFDMDGLKQLMRY
ncbi:MAG: type IX secretion system outer membrane channel protein PorV [Candidatus Symbiothrix sp.]|jgi:hypothetical protein|nr:type IX secretion system outer membrane channel protein PorV [Candidatus Symbiothrix sp.]